MNDLIPKVDETATNVPPIKLELPKTSPAKSKPTFGVLKEVPLDEIWNADGDFTQWFEENVAMLDAALGKKFTDVRKINKGDFIATAGKRTVLIETQLQQTSNHNLGRLLVHATEHAANVVVWVVAEVRSEHRNTVRWINSNSKVGVHLVELHAYKVGDTMIAANFEVVEKP